MSGRIEPVPPRATGGATARPLAERLREETRAAHDRVERTASFNRLIVIRIPEGKPSPTAEERALHRRAVDEYREVYRRFLIAAHGFEDAVNRRLAEPEAQRIAQRAGHSPEANEPTALIRDDLVRVFGAGAVAALPVMDGLPPVRSLGGFAGVEYVRRGSRMGGAAIGSVVQHNLGYAAGTGASFLGQYGKRTRPVVTEFKQWLDALGLDDTESRAAVENAIGTFTAVERWHLMLEREFDRA
jgi:heme oxygenase